MAEKIERLGPFAVSGTIGWTFPAGFVLLIGLIACYAGLALFGFYGRVFPCEEQGRLASSFLVAGAASGACLGVAAFDSVLMRLVAGAAGAIVLSGLAYWGVAAVFAPHC